MAWASPPSALPFYATGVDCNNKALIYNCIKKQTMTRNKKKTKRSEIAQVGIHSGALESPLHWHLTDSGGSSQRVVYYWLC
jgi:hypothetical protein